MESKKKSYVLIGIMVILIIILFVSLGILGKKYLDLKKDKDESNTKPAIKENIEDEKDNEIEESGYDAFVKKTQESRTDTVILQNKEGEDSYKIELKSNGDVVVNTKTFNNKTVASNILKGFVVSSGQDDVGDGRNIVLLKENGTLIALTMNDLLLANEINIIYNFNSISNIVDVYEEKEIIDEYEPPLYRVYAKDYNNQTYEITDNLLND